MHEFLDASSGTCFSGNYARCDNCEKEKQSYNKWVYLSQKNLFTNTFKALPRIM